jgi:hypothetical protein
LTGIKKEVTARMLVINEIEGGELKNVDARLLDAGDVVKMTTADETLMRVQNSGRQKELDAIVREISGITETVKKRKREDEELVVKRLKTTGDFMSLDGFEEPVLEKKIKENAGDSGHATELSGTDGTHSISLIHSVDGYSCASLIHSRYIQPFSDMMLVSDLKEIPGSVSLNYWTGREKVCIFC